MAYLIIPISIQYYNPFNKSINYYLIWLEIGKIDSVINGQIKLLLFIYDVVFLLKKNKCILFIRNVDCTRRTQYLSIMLNNKLIGKLQVI